MNINNTKDLDDAIASLKVQKKNEAESLKIQFKDIVESFKPKNLIKSAFKNATEGSSVGSLLLKTAAGISGGFLKNNLKLASSSSLMGIATNTLKSGLSGTILKILIR